MAGHLASRRTHGSLTVIVVLAVAMLGLTSCQLPVLSLAVSSTTDAPDASPGDGTCATGFAECTLRAAIQEANATAGPVQITLQTGAIYTLAIAGAGENAAATGDLDVTGTVVIHGSAATIDGNGLDRVLHIGSGGHLVAHDLTVTNGLAVFGGGVLVDGGASLGLLRASVRDNEANDHQGCNPGPFGGFSCNFRQGGGGGITNSGALTVVNSTISGNQATTGIPCASSWCFRFGGGVDNRGQAAFVGVTFSGNEVQSGPGGALTNHEGAGATIVASTFVDNLAGGDPMFASQGTGIYGTMTLHGSVLSGASPLCGGYLGGSTQVPVSAGYNATTDASCAFGQATDLPVLADARLGPLNNNGGPTRTHVVGEDSPLVDVIPAADPLCAGLPSDQRGKARPTGTGCDIGAVERQPDDR